MQDTLRVSAFGQKFWQLQYEIAFEKFPEDIIRNGFTVFT